MNNLISKDIKNIYGSYFILIAIIIFVSVYFIINYNKVMNNNFYSEDFVKPILITFIIILICNLVIFTNDSENEFDSSDHNIYKIINDNTNNSNDDNFDDLKEQKIYKILNDKSNNKNIMKLNNDNSKSTMQKLSKNSNSDDKYLNKNIFLPYKNKGVKFQLKT